jgi:small ligand-binding sensory domain FIST
MKRHRVTENRAAQTVEEAINFAIGAAQEAYDGAGELATEFSRESAARMAYRNCMPMLETKESAKAFVACVAQGVHLQFIAADEAKLLLYGVQVWLQVESGRGEMVTGG